MCSAPSLSNTLSYTKQVHKTSKKCLWRASRHLATQQGRQEGHKQWHWVGLCHFPKAPREQMWSQGGGGTRVRLAPPGTLFTSSSSFPQQPHEVDDMTRISQMRTLKIREVKSFPQSHSDSCVNITMPGT